MKAYSKDVRARVLRAVDQGRPRAEIVQKFGVSLAAIKRYRRTIPNHQKVARVSGGKISPYPRPQYVIYPNSWRVCAR